MSSITFSDDITPKEIRSLSAMLAGESAIPRRKDRKAETSRFVSLAGNDLKKFKKAAAAGDMGGLVKIAKGNVSTDTSGERRGRKSQFTDTILHTKVTVNPRREGTHGHRSMDIIIKAGEKGIAHSAFKKAGGRNNDLTWDISHKHVEITNK